MHAWQLYKVLVARYVDSVSLPVVMADCCFAGFCFVVCPCVSNENNDDDEDNDNGDDDDDDDDNNDDDGDDNEYCEKL